MIYVFTFDGLVDHDDKFSRGLKNRVWNLGRVIRWCYRNSWKDFIPSIRFILQDKNATLKGRLGKSLAILKTYFSGADWVIMTRIDSDDMFRQDMVQFIQCYPRLGGALICHNGFIYNSTTNEMAEWKPLTNPPFYSIIFPGSVFFDTDEHLKYYKDFKSHEDISKIFNPMVLPDYLYCVLTHNPKNHISTVWNHPFRGQLVNPDTLNLFR